MCRSSLWLQLRGGLAKAALLHKRFPKSVKHFSDKKRDKENMASRKV
jgi:hypothetical protein